MAIKTRLNNWDGGANPDTPRNLIRDNEAATINNAVYRAGKWIVRDGYTTPYTATADGFNIVEVVDYVGPSQTSSLLCATKDSIYYLNGTTWTNRLNLGTTRSDTDKWFFAEGDSQSWACNGLDNIYVSSDPTSVNYTAITWDTATVGSSAGTTVTRANIPLFMNNRVFLCNVTDGTDGLSPFRVRYTNALDYDRTEAATGFYDFDDSQSEILAATTLMNNALVLFKDDMVGLIQNTGNPVLSPALRFRPGILAPKAWCHLPNGAIFYISPDGLHLFNGGLPEELGRRKVRKYFFDTLDETNKANLYCWTNWKEAEIVIHIPTSSGVPDKALVYNWAYGVWSTWDFSAYCGFYRFRAQTDTTYYYGAESGDVKLGGGADDDGTAITAVLETKAYNDLPAKTDLRPGQAGQITNAPNYMQVNRVYTDARPTTTTVSVGEADYGTEVPTYNNSATVTDTDGYQPVANVDATTTGFISIKASGWTSISEMTIDWTGAGDV